MKTIDSVVIKRIGRPVGGSADYKTGRCIVATDNHWGIIPTIDRERKSRIILYSYVHETYVDNDV